MTFDRTRAMALVNAVGKANRELIEYASSHKDELIKAAFPGGLPSNVEIGSIDDFVSWEKEGERCSGMAFEVSFTIDKNPRIYRQRRT